MKRMGGVSVSLALVVLLSVVGTWSYGQRPKRDSTSDRLVPTNAAATDEPSIGWWSD